LFPIFINTQFVYETLPFQKPLSVYEA